MKKLFYVAIAIAFTLCACDSDSVKIEIESPEIILEFPAKEQGEIVNIPINTPIKFIAKLTDDHEGEISWSLEDDRQFRSLDNFCTFSENGLFKIMFFSKTNLGNDHTFIWVNVVGKVVTDIDNDEVGCAIAENENGIYIVTKLKEKFTDDGAYVYHYSDDQLSESEFMEGVGRIQDIKKFDNGEIVMVNTNGELRMNDQTGVYFKTTDNLYSEYHFTNKGELYTGLGVDLDRENVFKETRDVNGDLIEKKKLTTSGTENICDACLVNDSICIVLYSERPANSEDEIAARKINIKNDTDKWFDVNYDWHTYGWTDARFKECETGTLIYPIKELGSPVFVKIDNDLKYEAQGTFEHLVYSDDSYFCGDLSDEAQCHDYRIWGWETDGFYNFMMQNDRFRINKEYGWGESLKLLQSTSLIKVDWMYKSDDSILILTNTKKYNEYGFYNKRFCTIYRMNFKGEFIDV